MTRQREIKFRAWNKDRQEMLTDEMIQTLEVGDYGWDVYIGGGLKQVLSGDSHAIANFYHPSSTCILMQYTGLKDKNGKEIYEGDIVEIECECGYRDKMVVEWGYNGYRLKQIWSHRFPSGELELQQLNRTEVVGNIYENPELLEKESPE